MKTMQLMAIRNLKGLKGSPPMSYTTTYSLDPRWYKCSDSFCSRFTPSVKKDIAYFLKDFLGFTITEYQGKTPDKDFSIEKELPEFFRICKMVKDVEVTKDTVTTKRKTDTWFLFKLLRHYMWDYSYAILQQTMSLMDKGHSFFTSYILATYSHFYKGGTTHASPFNGRFLITLITDNYVLYNNNVPSDSVLPIIYNTSVKDFLDTFAKTHVLSACYLGSYNVVPEYKTFYNNGTSMGVSFSAIYHLKDIEQVKKVIKDAKKFKEYIKAEQWDKAAKMTKTKANYWD